MNKKIIVPYLSIVLYINQLYFIAIRTREYRVLCVHMVVFIWGLFYLG